ncbi:MAG: preprotein translocase subunit SecG [Halioglobus sp.]
MEQIFLVVHLLVALTIIGLIMLQQGKGADAGASFGAGASQTIFGSDGSGNVLTRATSWLVVGFFATSFGLAMLASQKSAPVDDLGLDIPAAVEMVQQEESDLPQVEDEFPEAASMDADVPVVDDELSGPADASEATAPEEDVPAL